MSDKSYQGLRLGVPATTPVDLPMPPYRYQRDGAGNSPAGTETAAAKKAAEILRQANLLGCSASTRR